MIETIHHWFQMICLAGCLACLGALAVWFAFRHGLVEVWDKARRMWSLSKIETLVCVVIAIGFIQYGATKGGKPNPQFGPSLTDNGSMVSNNFVHLKWNFTGHQFDDIVHVFYAPTNNPNATPLEIAQVQAGEYEWYLDFIGADQYYWIAQFSETPQPIDTKDEEAFVCQMYQHLPDTKPEEFVPIAVDITIDKRGIFDFIPRPPMPPDAEGERPLMLNGGED